MEKNDFDDNRRMEENESEVSTRTLASCCIDNGNPEFNDGNSSMSDDIPLHLYVDI